MRQWDPLIQWRKDRVPPVRWEQLTVHRGTPISLHYKWLKQSCSPAKAERTAKTLKAHHNLLLFSWFLLNHIYNQSSWEDLLKKERQELIFIPKLSCLNDSIELFWLKLYLFNEKKLKNISVFVFLSVSLKLVLKNNCLLNLWFKATKQISLDFFFYTTSPAATKTSSWGPLWASCEITLKSAQCKASIFALNKHIHSYVPNFLTFRNKMWCSST